MLSDLSARGGGPAGRQLLLPFPTAEGQCPTCHGRGDVYYLAGRPNVVGGKRVVCPVCTGAGRVRVPSLANEQPGE